MERLGYFIFALVHAWGAVLSGSHAAHLEHAHHELEDFLPKRAVPLQKSSVFPVPVVSWCDRKLPSPACHRSPLKPLYHEAYSEEHIF